MFFCYNFLRTNKKNKVEVIMKKIIGLCLIILIVGLSGCKKNKRTMVIDDPADSVYEELSLDSVKNGTCINPNLDRTGAYYEVKTSNDIKGSLFYQVLDMDEYLKDIKRFKSITIQQVGFNNSTPYSDINSFYSALNNSDYGLTADKIGIEFTSGTTLLGGNLGASLSLGLPSDYTIKENDKAQLLVMYLPINGIYYDGTQVYTNVYIMVPVYYAFIYESNVTDYSYGVKQYQLDFINDNNGLLPSKN